MRPNTYNPDCDFDPDQRDLDASIEERNKTEPNATARARAWLEANTPLRWVDEILDAIPFGNGRWNDRIREHFGSIRENAAKLEIEFARSLL